MRNTSELAGRMPEGTGMWLIDAGKCQHVFTFHLSFGTSTSDKKENLKIEFKKNREGLLGLFSVLNRSKVYIAALLLCECECEHTHTLAHTSSYHNDKSYVVSLCADIDKPDKGHFAFIYFAKATVLVGCVVQSISSFNGLRSEKLKCCVSACLAP